MPGSLHARLAELPAVPDPPPPAVSAHDPVNTAPIFFSVSRSSPGLPGTAVRAAFVLGDATGATPGAGADVFVSVKLPGATAGEGLNLLFIDNAELGLMPTDDLDALTLWVDPLYRGLVPPDPAGHPGSVTVFTDRVIGGRTGRSEHTDSGQGVRADVEFFPPEGGGCGTTSRWFGASAPSRVAPWPSCFDTDRPVREDSR